MSMSFVFGNGGSRKADKIDINAFKNLGVTIGCNAVYRDFSPDILISTDPGIAAEVAASNYPRENKCYFRDWEPMPIDNLAQFKSLYADDAGVTFEDTTDGFPEFVANGTEFEEFGETRKLTVYLIGTSPSKKIFDLKRLGCDVISKESNQRATYEFSGPQAADVGTKLGNDVYLLGFDFTGNVDGTINNVYAGSKNYDAVGDIENVKLPVAIIELLDVVKRNPHNRFYRVGPYPSDDMRAVFAQQENFQFVTYLDFFTLYLKVDSVQYRYL